MQHWLQIIKQNSVKTFIAVVILLLIISAILKAISPPQVSVPQSSTYTQTNYYGQTTTFKNISYTGSQIEVPTQMTVARQIVTNNNIETVVAQLVQEYQLHPVSTVENAWTGQSYSLSKTNTTNSYTLSKEDLTPLTNKVVDKATATSTAKSFLSKYFPNLQINLIEKGITYFQSSVEPVETDASKANLIYLPFTYQVDGYPVYFQTNSNYPFSLIVDADQFVNRFEFSPSFVQITPIQKQNTISLNQAVQNINAGHASLSNIGLDASGVTDLSQITSANLKSVEIEYRADDKSTLVYPFYRFSGEATNSAGQTFTVEIITPAIQTTTGQ